MWSSDSTSDKLSKLQNLDPGDAGKVGVVHQERLGASVERRRHLDRVGSAKVVAGAKLCRAVRDICVEMHQTKGGIAEQDGSVLIREVGAPESEGVGQHLRDRERGGHQLDVHGSGVTQNFRDGWPERRVQFDQVDQGAVSRASRVTPPAASRSRPAIPLLAQLADVVAGVNALPDLGSKPRKVEELR